MAVAFRAAASQASTGTGNSITINKPAGTIAGDVMVAIINVATANVRTFTPPTGWTQLDTLIEDVLLASPCQAFTFYKAAGQSEGASYLWTCDAGSLLFAGCISTFSGVDTAVPINVSAMVGQGTADQGFDTPVVVTTRPNCGIVGLVCGTTLLGNGPQYTWPANTTEDAEGRATVLVSNNPSAGVGHDNTNQVAAGNTTARSITSDVSCTWITSTIALTAAAGPPPVRVLRQAVKRSASF